MDLVCELFRGRRVTDPKRPGLLPTHPAVTLEQAEQQIADNIGNDIWLEEPVRNRLLPCELAVYTGAPTKV
jgi:hypothetical protein